MKFDHVNLTVANVVETSTFLKQHFGFSDAFEDNNAGMAVLADGHGMHINLMKGANVSYPKFFHIGFDMGSEAEVNAMYDRLKTSGMDISPPTHASWGSYTFHFTCPGANFIIEVECAPEEWS
ncbi:MAG: VOC family protein [Chloroflexaceae bacterium]|jgi:catechol 2,3-dioxygenase-like lactoylglutathione lyase family enzyme|nr:VOC family protein [Chloroflexaceae bacterium]